MYAPESEGFRPLRKAMSEPAWATPTMRRAYPGPDVLGARLTGLGTRLELSGNEWKPMVRLSSFTKESIPEEETPSESVSDKDGPSALVVVDPFSSGALLAVRAVAMGYRVIRVLSDGDSPIASFVADGVCVDYEATIVVANGAYEAAANALRALPYSIVALVPGAETGVEAADELAKRLGLRGNDSSKARRNKYLMGEAVRRAGHRAVKQRVVREWDDEAARFVEDLDVTVVKPLESAGSDDVFKCRTSQEAKRAVKTIVGKINGLGILNEGALIQEFLKGDEYVVDSVSRDGIQKVVSVWKYDKRPANGANFVYHGMTTVPAEPKLVEYSKRVCEALGIKNGPSHMELMVDGDDVCLVEVGARCHGGEGSWSTVAKACWACDQIDATLYAYLDEAKFAALSDTPQSLGMSGTELFFVTRTAGVVRSTTKATEFIEKLPSFKKIEWQVKNGDFAPPTVDCFTRPGSAQLVHEDKAQLMADCEAVRRLEHNKPTPLLDLEYVCKVPIDKGTVVVVDPYSSGAILAVNVRTVHRKKLVVVHSDPNSPIAALVASGTDVQPHAVVLHRGDVAETAAAVAANARAVVACVPGAETGVILADQLAERLGTRVNPPRLSVARRNKHLMGDAVRDAGVRAVRQTKATCIEDADAFLDSLQRFPVVVKPIESAGSDDVYKCTSRSQVVAAFETICGKINGLGLENDGALVQEFLQGDEYVVDAVSRDGIHKIVAIWKYDKRAVNGANFVYFGMQLVNCHTGPESVIAKILADYANEVRNALEITDGPSHMEVKYDPVAGPCLVEVGARCHGGEGTWIAVANACVGCNQVDATLDAYLDPDAFDALPDVPPPFKNYGREVDLVSYTRGTLKSINVHLVRSLKSFCKMELAVQPGSAIVPTIDCFTRPGSVQLIHPDPDVVQADYDRIRTIENEGSLFVLDDQAPAVDAGPCVPKK